MNEREQVINFLFQSVDQKNRIIDELQKQIAELQKQLQALNTPGTPPVPVQS